MKKPSDDPWRRQREQILGLGGGSFRKSHYPSLRQRLTELERFRSLIDLCSDLLLVLEVPSGRISDANLSACSQLGVTHNDLLQRSFGELIAPDGWEKIQDCFRAFVDRRDTLDTWTTQLLPRQGEPFPAEIALRCITAGPDACAVLSARDVRQRLKAEQQLRLAQFSVDRASTAVFWILPDARFVYVNDTACRSLGYSSAELLHMTVHDIDPEFTVEVWPDHWRQMQLRESFTFQSRHRTRQGREFPVEITINYRKFAGEEYTFAFATDISERVRAEQVIEEAQRTLLERQLEETERVEAELAKVRQRLVRQTRLATIGQLAGSVAHELRNPLGAIRNAVYLLRRKVPDDHPKWHEYLDILWTETEAANRIITQLLAVTRGKAPNRTLIPLGELIERARKRVAAPAAVSWQCTTEPAPFLVHVDAEQIEQVLVNVLTNALDAIEGDGKVMIEAERDDRFDRIVVADTGCGVAPSARSEVFEPLFSTKPKGTGLGLAICQQIVEHHGGTIALLESDAPGAAFEIRLPSPR